MSLDERKLELIQQLAELHELRIEKHEALGEAAMAAQAAAAELEHVRGEIASVEAELYRLFAGEYAPAAPSSLAAEIVRAMRREPTGTMSIGQLERIIGTPGPVLRATLSDMTSRGMLQRVGRGVYCLKLGQLPPKR